MTSTYDRTSRGASSTERPDTTTDTEDPHTTAAPLGDLTLVATDIRLTYHVRIAREQQTRRLFGAGGDRTTVEAVRGVSLAARQGEFIGLVGRNGSGKSTTMRMLTGLLPASEGEARILGQRPGSGGDARRHVGYMSQSFSLYGELTVRQNLRLHADLFHLPRDRAAARIAAVLRDFDLEAVADAAPGHDSDTHGKSVPFSVVGGAATIAWLWIWCLVTLLSG